MTLKTAHEPSREDWLLGLADLMAAATEGGARRIERAHLAIADESFNVLASLAITRPVSEPIRVIHHGIARLSYRSVALAAGQLRPWLRAAVKSDRSRTTVPPGS